VYSKAKVIRIEKAAASKGVSIQDIHAVITTGRHKGQKAAIKNYLWDEPNYNTYLKINDTVVVRIRETDQGAIDTVTIYGYSRDNILLAAVIVFLIAALIVCGKKGLKIFLALLVNGLLFVAALIPMLKAGFNPLLACLATAFASAAIMLALILGDRKKTFTALISVTIGIAFAGIVTVIFAGMARISGTMVDGSRMILTVTRALGDWHISDFKGIVAGGTIIASLGAVIDVVVDIIVGMDSVYKSAPCITKKELFSAGMAIGKDVLGGMLVSLLLVFTSTSLISMILYSALKIQFMRVINWEFFAVTILEALVSSMSFVITIPVTVLLADIIYLRKPND
jgi:uncharacterized membrane protein